MRGRLIVHLRKRVPTLSRTFKDQWKNIDHLTLVSDGDNFKTHSKATGKKYLINKSEASFVKLVLMCYGAGDYNILTYGKGRERGRRRFWDGIITQNGTFIRRKESGNKFLQANMNQTNSKAKHKECYVGRYLKTKKPGVWHRL